MGDEKVNLADKGEAEGTSSPPEDLDTPAPRKPAMTKATQQVAQTAELSIDAKNEQVSQRYERSRHPFDPSRNSQVKLRKAALALDDDVATVDKLLKRTSYYVVVSWVALVLLAYWAVPPEDIRWLEGTERNAALVELTILGTAVVTKHFPLIWDMQFRSRPASPSVGGGRRRSALIGSTHVISGILAGGLVTQFIALMTVVLMVCLPVPVMIDPVLGSRSHFLRWCEWAPLAGFMTLMTECIDAPEFDGEKMVQPWKKKYLVSSLASISTLCGFFFPFCTNVYVWSAVMLFSCVTYSSIIFRFFDKSKKFRTCIWRGGGSVDEAELHERARMSFALQGMCTIVWTLITLNYFVTSCGHLFVSESWTILHDPSATMIGECFMDLLAKCLYMMLIIEAHTKAFDEAKRANRRLAELKNTMGVVWENSSDTIAISVQKLSGSVSTMISPSFFRPALSSRLQHKNDDICAIVLEHSNIAVRRRRESITDMPKIKENELSDVGIKVVSEADFADINLNSTNVNGSYEYLSHKNDPMTSLVTTFSDLLARAWQSKSDELLFEHDAVLEGASERTKYEVKATRLDENAVVVVVRNVSERYRRFEAEKQFVLETTARQKDAEANRFTRHEVKNGLLAAIEICGNLREQLSNDINMLQADFPDTIKSTISEESVSGRMESIAEMDRTLHEVLNIVLAETMGRDVIHELYVPRVERIDVNQILKQTRGFRSNENQFSVVCNPSPLPIILSDQGLFKCIHGNAIRNAVKYGQQGGNITTEATYDFDSGEFEMKVINLPGQDHEKLVAMGSRANELVFSHGTRLHRDSDLGKRSHSAGDGAWIVHKCAKILGGSVSISFEKDRTVFNFRAPARIHDAAAKEDETFHLPHGVWGIAIDDSKIQRKLLRRFLLHAGVHENRSIVLGRKPEEIGGFVDFVVDCVSSHPSDLFLIIVDENLEMDGDVSTHETISGSECIKQIRSALEPKDEQRILALVRSANDSPQDLALYNSRAHGYMPKVPLQGMSVREMVSPLWKKRFPQKEGEDDDSDESMSRVASIENLRDLTIISPAELLAELTQIDSICVRNRESISHDLWPVIWDKLHQLKGDLKSVNVEDKFSKSINLIETLKGASLPADFMTTWLQIRTDVVEFISEKEN